MGNGDCPVGATNKANIGNIMRSLKRYESQNKSQNNSVCQKIDKVDGKIDRVVKDFYDFKLSFHNWLVGLLVSTLLLLLGVVANIVVTYIKGGVPPVSP